MSQGQKLFAEYKAAAENLRDMGWADDHEWTLAEARLAAAEHAMNVFLGGAA